MCRLDVGHIEKGIKKSEAKKGHAVFSAKAERKVVYSKVLEE